MNKCGICLLASLIFLSACARGIEAKVMSVDYKVNFVSAKILRQTYKNNVLDSDWSVFREVEKKYDGIWSTEPALNAAWKVFVGGDFIGMQMTEVRTRLGSSTISPFFSPDFEKKYGGSGRVVYAVDSGSSSLVMRLSLSETEQVIEQEVLATE